MNSLIAPSFYFVAGEPSGDLHGAKLLNALKREHPNLKAMGVGGPHLKAEGLDIHLGMESLEVMGLSDVLKTLPRLWKAFRKVRKHILTHNPEVVILIDYPGFNLRLAKGLMEKGYKGKIVQYVCPTIWAHSIQRIDHMAETLDLLLTIYPFEMPYFANSSLRVEYIGNPLVEYVRTHCYEDEWITQMNMSKERPIIALFPGSRRTEILSHMPALLKAAELLKNEFPDAQFAISAAKSDTVDLLQKIIAETPLRLNEDIFLVPKKYTYELMKDSHVAVAKSGTVTLELALHACPTVVFYNLSWVNWLYAKLVLQLRLKHYCIVNILEGKEVFPELIKNGFSISDIAQSAGRLYRNTPERDECLAACSHLQEVLRDNSASLEAAQKIHELL